MKCTIIIDEEREEEVVIYANRKRKLTEEIEELCQNDSVELIGYIDKSAIKIFPNDVLAFLIENNKVYALLENAKLLMKQRLYEIEQILENGFVKINQSCIVNIKHIARFDASFAGALMVTLKNGYKDYVSRRQLKTVKERIGL